jgi:hypothetical protein
VQLTLLLLTQVQERIKYSGPCCSSDEGPRRFPSQDIRACLATGYVAALRRKVKLVLNS